MQEAKPVGSPNDLAAMESNEQMHVLNASRHETYRRIMGCLRFMATQTRPDSAVAAGQLSPRLHNPVTNHMKTVRGTLCYLKATSQKSTTVNPNDDIHLTAYVDANYANNVEIKRRSRTRILLIYGNAVVSATTSFLR